MEIEFKLVDKEWIAEFTSIGLCSVMVFRQWRDDFTTYYGKDKNTLIKYDDEKSSDDNWSKKNIGFEMDVPQGCLVKMVSKSPVVSCTITEKILKTTGSISITDFPDATANESGLMAAADKVKLDSVEEGANKYVLQTATTKSTGGIALGYTSKDRNYALQVSTDGRGFVNVPWMDTVYTLPQASASALGGIKLGHDNKLLYEYPVEVDSEGRAYVSVPQRELSGLQKIELESYANDYVGIWSTSASDVTYMDFVMGDNIDAGNISDGWRWRFTTSNLLGTTNSPDKPRESDLHTIMSLFPKGAKGGVLKIADSNGVMQQALTKADFASIVVDDVTDENIKDVVKQLLSIVKPATK